MSQKGPFVIPSAVALQKGKKTMDGVLGRNHELVVVDYLIDQADPVRHGKISGASHQ
jgi:hypothetical protein